VLRKRDKMKILIERGTTWKLSELPEYSLALDGAVQGPELDLAHHRISVDHHDGCLRMFTSATCKQVLDMLLLGFNPEPYTVYVNDVDGDTAMAVWLLQNPKRVTESKVRRLVEVVAAMDAHGPAYPTADEGLCSGFYDDAMAPERDARRNKTYGQCDLRFLLANCTEGITALIDNYAGKIKVKEPEADYQITHTGKDWVMATSEGWAFSKLYKDGHTTAVAYRILPDHSVEYTIGKKSDLVDFPLGPHSKPGTILHALAAVEPGWGGGSTIGGAVRHPDGSRSRLAPTDVVRIISDVLASTGR